MGSLLVRRSLVLGIVLTALPLWLGTYCWSAETLSQKEFPTIKFQCGSWAPQNHYNSALLDFFSEELAKLSGGKLTTQNLYSAALWGLGEEPQALGGGVADCGTNSINYQRGKWPICADAASLAFAFTLEMGADMLNLPFIGDKLRQEMATTGMVPIAGVPAVVGLFMRQLPPKGFAATPISETFKGLRFSAAAAMGQFATKLGASVVSIPSPEIPIAYHQGQLDANFTSYGSWKAQGTMPVAPIVYRVDSVVPMGLSFNKKRFDSLPPSVQDLIKRAGMEASRRSVEREKTQIDSICDEAKSKYPDKVKIIVPTKEEREAWQKIITEIQWNEYESRGPEQKKVVETLKRLVNEGYTPSWSRSK